MEIKTTISYYFILTRMAITTIENQKTTSVGKNMEKWELKDIVGGIIQWYAHCGKEFGGSLKS